MNAAEKKTITYIKVSELHPHPNNPRKNLGDLTELSESIKRNGIHQNLTVVDGYKDENGHQQLSGYTVIIGHRRLEAAKLAGLEEVPCVIAYMSDEEQLSTMLLENMQRSDLTYYEQAQGFQILLDIGETVGSIAEKTGFSESTVRSRLKLNTLDSETFKSVKAEQISLTDMLSITEIEDETERKKVLETVGTDNFRYKYRSAIQAQEQKKANAKATEKWKAFGVKQGTQSDYSDNVYSSKKFEHVCYALEKDPDKFVGQHLTDGWFYLNYGQIYFFYPAEKKKKQEKTPQEIEDEKKREHMKRLEQAMNNVLNTCCLNFVEHCKKTVSENKCTFVMRAKLAGFLSDNIINGFYLYHQNMMSVAVGKPLSENKQLFDEIPNDYIRMMLIAGIGAYYQPWARKTDHIDFSLPSYYYAYQTQENRKKLFDILEYRPSYDETALFNGSHELYDADVSDKTVDKYLGVEKDISDEPLDDDDDFDFDELEE